MARTETFALPALAHPLPGAQRRRLKWVVVAVVLGHVALLAATQSAGGGTEPAVAHALQVRVLPALAALAPDHALAALAEEAPSPVKPERQPLEPTQALAAGRHADTAGDADAVYLPRAALTVVPRAQTPVTIAYPYFDGEAERYSGEFEIFIDDTGGVVRVTSATPNLPGILVGAVREAFLGALFSPGEREGKAVRSRIRIEVTFDKADPQPS